MEGGQMDILQLAAMELAKEVKEGNSLQFNFNNQTIPACIELLAELKCRAPGYASNQYVHAISSAIESNNTKCKKRSRKLFTV